MTFAFVFESVGGTEWLVLLGVILIVVGPKNLPSAARKFGQMMSTLRRAADEFKRQLMSMDEEVRKTVDDAVKTDYVETPKDDASDSPSAGSEPSADGSEDRAETDYYGGEYDENSPYPGHEYYDETQDPGDGGSEMGDGDASGSEDVAETSAAEPEPVKPAVDPYKVTITVSTAARKTEKRA